MFRKTYALIDKGVLSDNVKEITSKYPQYEYYFGVVKGNCYGHGFGAVNALIKGGVNYIAVSSAEEALAVREQNGEIPILVLEPVTSEFFDVAEQQKITLTVDSLERFEEILKSGRKLSVHIKIDSGMNRLGIKDKTELNRLFEDYGKAENVFIEGIYTHLATSGVNDKFYDIQVENFKKITADIDLKSIPIVHIGRSLILVHHKKPDFVNGVRLGICMYGFSQSLPVPTGLRKIKRDLMLKNRKISETVLSNDLKLKTAMTVKTEVMAVKNVKKGEFLGYGAEYIADSDLTVATLPIGYFDGVEKGMKYVYLNGKRREILGEVCMDMITVRADKNTKIGDTAEIFGENISVRETARNLGVSSYRVLTGITSRVPRIYK